MRDYIELDFESFQESLKEILRNSETFRDYNYEGSNISTLIQLISYLSELSTYYMNRLVRNIYPESTEMYQTAHSVASIRGYRPRGWIAPHLNLDVKVLINDEEAGIPNQGDQLFIPAWFPINSGLATEDGDSIFYITTDNYTIDIPTSGVGEEYDFRLPMKQGTYETLEFTGDDIVNNKILLPFYRFDYDTIPYNENPGISLYVNEMPWTRVREFRHHFIGEEENVYMLEYDKYERYNIVFSPSYGIPEANDNIQVIMNRTLGSEGDIYSGVMKDFDISQEIPVIRNNSIEFEEKNFIENLTQDRNVNEDLIEISNTEASFNSSEPETISEIIENSRSAIYSQLRNTKSIDYKDHLKEHPDVVKGNAWGEQEIDPGNTEEYNKVYVSVIPTEFDSTTIETSGVVWERTDIDSTVEVRETLNYNSTFEAELFNHLSERKMIGVFEILELPELVYFAFDIGLEVYRGFNFTSVKEEIKKKLSFYFSSPQREFNEVIDFRDINNYILDTSIRNYGGSDRYLIKGIKSFVFRDILTFTPSLSGDPETIYEPNDSLNYPMFTVESFDSDYYNTLRPIRLGLNQFPVLTLDNSIFINEG